MPRRAMISVRIVRSRAVCKIPITIGSLVITVAAIINAACERHDNREQDPQQGNLSLHKIISFQPTFTYLDASAIVLFNFV